VANNIKITGLLLIAFEDEEWRRGINWIEDLPMVDVYVFGNKNKKDVSWWRKN
jgi:hypothetical protein